MFIVHEEAVDSAEYADIDICLKDAAAVEFEFVASSCGSYTGVYSLVVLSGSHSRTHRIQIPVFPLQSFLITGRH